jgi:hypothetical protein
MALGNNSTCFHFFAPLFSKHDFNVVTGHRRPLFEFSLPVSNWPQFPIFAPD